MSVVKNTKPSQTFKSSETLIRNQIIYRNQIIRKKIKHSFDSHAESTHTDAVTLSNEKP